MSAPTPPRLLDLAGRHLLRAEDLDVSTLESVPTELFPPLFLEAFDGYRTETLKAMVQTWPFVRLPLGALIDLPHVGPLQAVLEALDVLLAQKVRSRRCKLRVLDLRKTGQNFWSMWSGASSYGCSGSRTAAVAEPRSMTRQPSTPLKVFLDLCLKKRTLDNFLTYFLRWVEQRKSSIHLCCKKLKIVSMPMDKIVKVLSTVQLDCIQEVQKQEHDHVVQITSQFRRLGHLRDLHLESPSFLEGCLDQMLRCLRSPLDSLSITKCRLTESDLTHVSQSPDISQLKSLDLSGVPMTDFRPELLQVLLEKVAATLQEVDLDACGITDSQLEAFLPALSRCSQLRAVSLCGNLLSTAVLEKLLRHTAVLPCLRQERYPAPQESYRPRGVLLEARLARLRAQLLEILRDLGRPRIIWISLSPCPRCGEDVCHHMEPIVYSCPAPA
ncbi:PRAME family member 12-like [Bos indicus x Bos taurus]|uniref:PRAME family member 12-like n=1 Tax=Bos indicus x Bos taurus TaxID=30522 RepID=UPI000F7D2B90|nr:PRAME family member 12-like [Bos indicus x Bos taurus]XP_027391488.1 PRAME family member 12-like [Bos indicus x Bos taurus]XP_027391489.1 PRAME family member 12-like [Bos indicus x Bos taurus]XP_027391490.1 PRAME family member 12-like [Bos indicus x Bos taurus]XP_027391492.1 PRAME family member 12-like [Bos indicus x Bos taurus]